MTLVEAIGEFQLTLVIGILIGLAVLFALSLRHRSNSERSMKLTFALLVLSVLAFVLGTYFYHGGLAGYHRMLSGAGRDPDHFDRVHAAYHSTRTVFSLLCAIGLLMTVVATLVRKRKDTSD